MNIENVCTFWQQADTEEGSSLDVIFGGHTTRLYCATPYLRAAFSPALSHLQTSFEHPEIEIFFREASKDVQRHELIADVDALGPLGTIPDLPTNWFGSFQPISGVLSLYDANTRRGYVAVREDITLPNFELAAPLRLMLGWIGAGNEFSMAHGAAIANQHGAALLVGRGGSGKSTTSLACLLAGFDFLGDDYVALTQQTSPKVWSLYKSAKIAQPSLTLYPELRSFIKRGPTSEFDDKYLLDIDGLTSQAKNVGKVITSAPLKAIILPRVTGNPTTTIVPASTMAALRALAPSTVFQQAGFGAIALENLTSLARAVPAYELLLGANGDAPNQIANVLADLNFR